MPLPPWLDTRSDYLANSLATGFQLGQKWREGNQRINLAKQQIAAKQNQTAMLYQLREDTLMANFQRAQTQAAQTKAYHDAQLGLAQRRVNIEGTKLKKGIQDKAKEISDNIGLANHLATGGNYLSGLAKFPNAKLSASEIKSGTTAKPDPYAFEQYKTLQAAYLNAVKAYEKSTNPGEQARLSRIATNYRQQVDALRPSIQKPDQTGTPVAAFRAGQPTPAPAAPAAAAASNLPQAGDVVNGYTFKGGELTDPKNWEAVSAPK
jgi:hypothetical protein